MDDQANPEHTMLRDQLQRFVRTSGDFEARKPLLADGGSAANWATYADNGWLGAGFSEQHGGYGGGAAEIAIVVGELGRGLILEPVAANMIAGTVLARHGHGNSSRDRLAAMISGSASLSFAHAEPANGYNYQNCATTLSAETDGLRLNGRKIVVTGPAPGVARADILVLARNQGLAGGAAYVIAIVDASAAGLDRQDYALVDGTRAADLNFTNVAVSPDDCIPLDGNDLGAVMDFGAFLTCAEAVAVMDAAFNMTLEYVRQRVQFGAPLGSNQALQHRLVDMMMQVREAEALTRRAADLLTQADAGVEAQTSAIAAAKIQCSAAARKIGQEAVQMHGGIGTTHEAAISHYFKRLVTLGRLFGDASFHRRRLAALMEREDLAAAGHATRARNAA